MFLVYLVGCIECGVESYPIRVVSTIEEAKTVAKCHYESRDSFVTIIDIEKCETVEYEIEQDNQG